MSTNVIDIDQYLLTHQQLVQTIEGLTDKQLKWKEAENKWSVTEVLSHLADHNIVVSFRVRDIISGSTAQLPAFDQDRWVNSAKANEDYAADILDVFKALLTYNSLLFNRLSAEDWQKTGVNFKDVTLTLYDVIHSFIAHVQVHLAQIDRIRKAAAN